MKKLFLLSLLCFTYACGWAQLRNNAGYDCDEEIFPRFDKTSRSWGYKNIVGQWRVDPSFDKAEAFSGKLAIVQRGTKFGLINCDGFLVANTQYDEIQNFVNGRGWARVGNLWGVLDDKGRLFVPPAFEEIKPISPRHDFTWVKKKGVWGIFYKDRGKMLVEPKYDACRSLSDSLVVGLKNGYSSLIYVGTGQAIYDSCTSLTKGGGNSYIFGYRHKYGLIQTTGNVLVRPEYDTLAHYKSYFLARKRDKWGVASLAGKFATEMVYQDAKGGDGPLVAVKQHGKWGYILANGKPFIPIEYDDALPNNGLFYGLERREGPKSWAIVRTSERLTEESFQYRYISLPFVYPVAVLHKQDTSYALLQLTTGRMCEIGSGYAFTDQEPWLHFNINGSTKESPFHWGLVDLRNFDHYFPINRIDDYYPLQEPFIRLGKKGINHGLYNYESKQLIIPKEYELIWRVEGTNLFQAQKQSKTYIFNQGGKLQATLDADRVLDAYKSGIYVIEKNQKRGLLQGDKVLIKPEYVSLRTAGTWAERGNLPLIARKKTQYHLLTPDGDKVSDDYDSLKYVGNGLFAGKRKEASMLLDKAGKELPGSYLAVTAFGDGLLLVQDATGWRYLSKALKPAFAQTYTQASPFANGAARVQQGNKQLLINRAGKVLQILEP